MSLNRWGQISDFSIDEAVNKSVPRNTVINKQSQWRQFMDFCESKNYIINKNTTICELASIMKDWAFNMRRKDGEDYKESVIKTLWNNTAKTLQDIFFKEHKIKFNPFEDIDFQEARKARDSKRKQLQTIQEKRKISAVAFTSDENMKMQKIWDENTPEGLQKKFFIIASKELAWRGNEAAYATTHYFKMEMDNYGNSTNRIEYNPIFTKTNQGGSKRCSDSKWLIPNSDTNICPVRLYHKILEKRPKRITNDRFFLAPNPQWQLTKSLGWFKNTPIGINTISTWTKETAQKVGLDTTNKKISNHSHRATAVTHLANANIPEQQLMKITGHTNSNSIQSYLNMQQNRHEEIVNLMRGSSANSCSDVKISNKNIQSDVKINNSEEKHPQMVYQHCTFHVQNMYCNNRVE